MALMSQRAYARHRGEAGLPGATLRAVQKAIASGRIQIGDDGLIDSDAADRAWEANSYQTKRRDKIKTTPRALRPAAPEPPEEPRPLTVEDIEGIPEAHPGMSLSDAAALEKVWKAKLARLEFEARSGKLVPAEEVVARWVELVTIAKTKLLAVPGKAKGRIPRLSAEDVAVLDELIREALEELVQGGDEEASDGS